METDTEMLQAFAEEVAGIKAKLKPITENIRTQYNQPKLYEQFGQTIDGIYGTAATLGFKEVAEYCRMMKAVTYKCSQSNNMYAMGQVKDMCMVAMAMLDKFADIIMKPEETKKFLYQMQKQRERAEEISKKLFGTISRTTTAA